MAPVVSVEGLSKSFGKYSILEELSLSVKEGEGYGLVGLNGAGKTTLLRLLLGLLKADSGRLSILGVDPWAHNASVYRRLGVVLEHDGFSGNLTALQNLKIFAAAKGVAWSIALRYLDEFWGWTAICNNKRPVKYFSRGQRVQCALCRAFLGWPAVYLLDEPIVALDVDAYDHFVTLVRAARERGGTFIISSHQLNAIDDLCDRVGILRDRTLTELQSAGRRGGSSQEWELDADPDARWASIIAETCGVTAARENGCWRFAVRSPGETVPLLVERLVKAGCAVRKVGPIVDGFSAAIRSQYQKKNPAGLSVQEKQAP